MAADSEVADDAPVSPLYRTDRMNALSDGVFSIVLTLLVLDLKLPERNESILTLMADDWHVFLAWLISFIAIARFWLVHHAITATLLQCHARTLALNFGVLGAVTLVPFSADIIGTERVQEPWSTVLFAVNLGLLSLTLGLLASHAVSEPHLRHPGHSDDVLGRHLHQHLYLLPAVTAAAALLAFVEPYLALGAIAAEFLVFGWLSGRRR